MPSFEDLFMKSGGKPIEYKGHVLHMVDRLPIGDTQTIRVTFESKDSEWRQGVYLESDGGLEIDGRKLGKSVVLWSDSAPDRVTIVAYSKKRELVVKNVWDVGDGVMHSWHNGAAMIIDALKDARRYRCNDGKADEDFDDLVFKVELLNH